MITPSFSFSSLDRAVGPHRGKDFNVSVQIAGVGGNVKYVSPIASYRQFFPMKGLKVNREGHNVLGYRMQLAHITGFGGEVAPPTHRFYSGGEQDLRGFDTRSVVAVHLHPEQGRVHPDESGRDIGSAQSDQSCAWATCVIPLPIYRMVSIGGDTQFIANLEYRIPIVNQVTFAFFTDFGMDFDAQPGQLRQSTAGQSLISGAQYGCPTIVNGACFGGSSVKFPELLGHRSGHQLCAAYVERRGAAGDSADRERSVPHLLRLQLAAALRGRSSEAGRTKHRAGRRQRIQGVLPDLRSRTVQLSAGAAVLWGRLYSAGAAEDIPVDGQHNLLGGFPPGGPPPIARR